MSAHGILEAQVTDVWKFLPPQQVADNFEAAAPHLGRKKIFWELASFFELTDKRDLDLFTLEPDGFRIAHDLAREAAAKAGAELEVLQSFTTFRRYLLRRGNE